VTDSGQAQHFEGVFGAARRAGWLPPAGSGDGPRVDHVGFGLVLGEDGKKFKTRCARRARGAAGLSAHPFPSSPALPLARRPSFP